MSNVVRVINNKADRKVSRKVFEEAKKYCENSRVKFEEFKSLERDFDLIENILENGFIDITVMFENESFECCY